MATSTTAALSSYFPAANLVGGPSLQYTGLLANHGCRNRGRLRMETNEDVNASRLVTLRRPRSTRKNHCFEISSSVTSGRNTVNKKLQACLAADDVGYNSRQQECSNGWIVDLDHFQIRRINDRSLPNEQQSTCDQSRPSEDASSPEQRPAAAAELEPHPYEGFQIGPRWREIQGERNWKGLLDPLDPGLRSEIIRYGDFAQATYDAFEYDMFSKFCGSCKFTKANFLQRLSLENRGYEIVQYLYSTSEAHLPRFFKKPDVADDEKWSTSSNWAGFVAVCTSRGEIARLGRRDIVVAWRGTVTNFEWIEDLKMSQCPTEVDPRRVGKGPSKFGVDLKVEKGFLSLYKSNNKDSRYNKASTRDQVLGALKRTLEKYEGEEMSITLTGHSLGGALATLCAYDIAESGLNVVHRQASSSSDNHPVDESRLQVPDSGGVTLKSSLHSRVPITAYTFASPRVGNSVFKHRVDELGVKVLRVVNIHDFVPDVPGLICNERLSLGIQMHIHRLRKWPLLKLIHEAVDLLPATYSHVGVQLKVDNLQSPFLKWTMYPISTHNLEVYLHLLDGLQGMKSGGFSNGGRDLALVNKSTDLLIQELKIPSFWFQEENKGLVRVGGRFTHRPRKPYHFPELPPPVDSFPMEVFH